MMSDKSVIDLYKKHLERERAARKAAEKLLEEKSRQLYYANNKLDNLNKELQQKVKDTSFELAKQRSRYFTLVHHAEDIIFITNNSGEIKYVNPIISRIMGFEPREVVGEDYLSLVLPGYRNAVKEFYENQLEQRIASTYYEFPVLTKTNKVLWLGQRLNLVETPDQRIELLGISRDITEGRSRERKLQSLTDELEQKADFLSAVNHFAISVMDKHSIREVVWEVTQNLIGHLGFEDCIIYLKDESGENLIQMAAYGGKASEEKTINDPIVIPVGKGITGHVAKTGIGEIIPDTSKDRRYIIDDEIRYSELAVPIISDGEVIGVIDSEHSKKHFFTTEHFDFVTTVASLISDKIKNTILLEKQREAERLVAEAAESIKKSEEKYRRIIENMNLGLMEVDVEGKIVQPYPIFCEMTGYNETELIGKKAIDVFLSPEYKNAMEQNDKERKSGESGVYEIEMLKKNGEKFWALISGAPIYGKSKEITGSIGIHLDITKQKQMQADLLQAQREAERARDFEKEFLANMSHEIRNPLHSVVGMANLLYDTPLSFEQKEYIDNIKYSADLLIALVSDILDMAKIAEGKMETSMKPFNLKDTFRGLKKTIEFKLAGSVVDFESSYDEAIPGSLISDPTYLNQVLLNLLTNAAKFTLKGKIGLYVDLEKIENEKVWIRFKIEDTGIGIGEEKIKTIFDRFSQAGKVDESRSQGTGLGLFITKKLTELLGGTIELRSKVGKGSVFTVVIPFAVSEPLSDVRQNKMSSFIDQKLKILIVEDNDINRRYIEKILEKNHIHYASCNDGSKAVEMLENQIFDMILMDIRMPVMDGYQTTIWLRSKDSNPNSTIPIIALTASALLDEKEKAINAGMNHHISKPFTPDTLLSSIHQFLPEANQEPIESDHIELPLGLDGSEIDALYEGDWDHAALIFEIFIKNIPGELKSVKDNLDEKDWDALKAALHKIKPNFKMVGLGIIESLVQNIEDLCKLSPVDESQVAVLSNELIQLVEQKMKLVEKGLEVISQTIKA